MNARKRLPEEAVEAAFDAGIKPNRPRVERENHRQTVREMLQAAAPAIIDQAKREERERLEPVVAAARRVLAMHYGSQSPSNPAAHALYSALGDLDRPQVEPCVEEAGLPTFTLYRLKGSQGWQVAGEDFMPGRRTELLEVVARDRPRLPGVSNRTKTE